MQMCGSVLDERVGGLNIGEVEHLPVDGLIDWAESLSREFGSYSYAEQVLPLLAEVVARAKNLDALKLSYLSLCRTIPTLSGGELQRVRLASQLGCSLNGLVYILDEPCKGLHARDIESIAHVARSLVDAGNTVVAIEHNGAFVAASDRVIEMGPSGGDAGGRVVRNIDSPSINQPEVIFKQPRRPKGFARISGIEYRVRHMHFGCLWKRQKLHGRRRGGMQSGRYLALRFLRRIRIVLPRSANGPETYREDRPFYRHIKPQYIR